MWEYMRDRWIKKKSINNPQEDLDENDT